jgi:hypothetical protein
MEDAMTVKHIEAKIRWQDAIPKPNNADRERRLLWEITLQLALLNEQLERINHNLMWRSEHRAQRKPKAQD